MIWRYNKTITATHGSISVLMEIALFSALIIFISNVCLNFKMSNEQPTALISFIHVSSTKWLFLYRDTLLTDRKNTGLLVLASESPSKMNLNIY